MAYYQAPKERPRHAKHFLTVRDIEDAAASGCREILHVDDLVITDAAREAAQDLGVAIIKPDPVQQTAAPAAPSTTSPSAPVISTYAPAARGGMPGMPAPAFSPPAHATFDGHPLVEELARAIRARWRPVQRRQRQLLA